MEHLPKIDDHDVAGFVPRPALAQPDLKVSVSAVALEQVAT